MTGIWCDEICHVRSQGDDIVKIGSFTCQECRYLSGRCFENGKLKYIKCSVIDEATKESK